MEEFAAIMILLGIGLFISGPIAVIMAIVLFNKLGSFNRRLNKLEGKTEVGPYGVTPAKPMAPAPKPAVAPVTPAPKPPVERPKPAQPIIQPKPTVVSRPPQTPSTPPKPSYTPPKPKPPAKPAPVTEVAAAIKEFVPLKPKPAAKGGLELKIGTTVALIVGVITVIIGVAFFLQHIYKKMTFVPVERISMVAVGGLVALVAGEILRRKNFEIVAKGIAALGFALLYTAVFSGSRVYALFSTEWAFGLSIVVTAAAMAYAVALDEMLIAFLALLGGYLSPVIISTGQNLPVPLFSYVFVLSAGAIGCAMFRRWRAVNWIAMVGTYLLYTGWFEKFYTADQMQMALFWLGVFGGMYLVLPILNGLVKKLVARSEDVTLVVVNSIAVYYYLWRMLYTDSRQDLAIASVILGLAHIVMVFVVLGRCRDDKKLQASLGVLGTAFITAAIPMYFNTLQPTLVGWSIEAVVLTFIGTRYKSLWTKAMATLVSAIAAAGLFYHLPLHTTEDFRLIFNSPFGTWAWVSAAILICHGLWRFVKNRDEESRLMAQVYYVAGLLLLAVGCALEWHSHCGWHIEYLRQDQAWFLMGLIVIAVALVVAFLTRPVCPKGDLVRTVGIIVTVFGSAFTALAMMGVYYSEFKLLLNAPAGIAAVFVASVFYGAWQTKQSVGEDSAQRQLPGALITMGLVLILALFSEQIYMYWYCRNEYGPTTVSNWQNIAFLYIFILWAVSGVVMLATGIRFNKPVLKTLSVLTSALSAFGLFLFLPLHFKGAFRFVFNQPFMTWACVSVLLLIGHGLWRFFASSKENETSAGSQIYYAAGLVLLAIGCAMEWFAHCEYQIIDDAVGSSNFLLGMVVLAGLLVLSFLARPLPPQGLLAKALGVLTVLGGAVWTALVMTEVYHNGFTIFANVPFMIAVAFVASILLAAWFVKRADHEKESRFPLSSALVLGGLVLVWVLLSEQIYQYFWCQRETLGNWESLSQMYMSVSWAVYAAVLIVLGFIFRAAGIRYLSLLIFAVLLGKINFDVWGLGADYRVAQIATFMTTGLILVGVSLLYQYLKNKGFFDTMEKQISNTEMSNEQPE
ncbi:MAG: DUF2339 domain-containing protein [Phycisphaerae bacterium]|nr:DUF2339 domain-containing protein [Phycisphaerae bacterium]